MILLNLFFCFFLTHAQSFHESVTSDGFDPKRPLQILTVSSAPESTMAGSRFPVTLQLTLAKGYSAYLDKMKIFPLFPDGTQASDVTLSPTAEFTDFGGKLHRGLVGEGNLTFFAELPRQLDEKITELKFDLEYVACTRKICLPKNTFSFSVPVHLSTLPNDMSYIEKKIESNLLLAFLLVFAFGFLTSLTPCVYPLIPITLAVIGARAAHSKKAQAFSLSLVYVLGIATTYSILGVIAAQTGALFGQALSYPPVVITFALLFFVTGLSLFGLFEIRAPHFVTQKLTSKGPSSGFVGVFVTGLIAGIIASPCVGPVLVGILAYIAKTQDSLLGFMLLFTFAMGMGILFIALGTFSSLVKKLPRSGGWMNVVKYALGICMIALSFYYIKPLLNKSTTSTETATSRVPLKNGWQLYSKELLEKARSEGKPVMIDFFAEWCGACVELDEKTFSKEAFISASKDFVLLKVDATEHFEGLDELQKTYDVFGLPTVVFLSRSGQLLKDVTLTGFEEVEQVLPRLEHAKKSP